MKQFQAHAVLGITNRFNIPDCPERVHWENEFALEVGAPGAYDYGPERVSWLTHHITNWMGDAGTLLGHKTRIRRHNPVGDVLYIDGEIINKFIDDHGRHCVEIKQSASQQDDELSIQGTAIVALPSHCLLYTSDAADE